MPWHRPTTQRRRTAALLAAAVSIPGVTLAGTAPALAASGDRIGDAIVIVNTVTADFKKKNRTLAAGDDVRQDEVIEVKPDAQGELKLDDDTKLALGPGSRLVLDKFVYDSDKKAGSIVLDLTKGAFRFMTGVAKKPTYVINTPNASITVRGTIFDLYILPDTSAWVLLHEGAVEITGRKSACRVLDQPGRIVRVTRDGSVGRAADWSKLRDGAGVTFDTAFPFIDKPPQIDPTPVLTRAAVIEGSQPDRPDSACVNPVRPAKVRKASLRDDDDDPKPRKKPAKERETKTEKPRVKVVTSDPPRKPRRPRDDGPSYGSSGIGGIGIVIGIGGGFGGKRGGGSGPSYPGKYPGGAR